MRSRPEDSGPGPGQDWYQASDRAPGSKAPTRLPLRPGPGPGPEDQRTMISDGSMATMRYEPEISSEAPAFKIRSSSVSTTTLPVTTEIDDGPSPVSASP